MSSGARKARTKTNRQSGAFFFGSFIGGIVVGSAIMLAITYPSGNTNVVGQAVSDMPPIKEPAPEIEWTFFTELPKAKLKTSVEPIEHPPPAQPENREYVLQAAHFHRRHDARVLQGALILDGMSASISSSPRADGGSWHRVPVGPYETEDDAQTALDQLRAKDIPAQILAPPLPPSTRPTT